MRSALGTPAVKHHRHGLHVEARPVVWGERQRAQAYGCHVEPPAAAITVKVVMRREVHAIRRAALAAGQLLDQADSRELRQNIVNRTSCQFGELGPERLMQLVGSPVPTYLLEHAVQHQPALRCDPKALGAEPHLGR